MQQKISRKDFFRQAFGFFKQEIVQESTTSAEVPYEFILLPGTENKDHFLHTCTKCYQCVSACPHESITVYRGDENNFFYGYPVIEPRRLPCYLCENYPCISACPEEALKEKNKNEQLGTAVINQSICFAYQGHFCRSCYNSCPSGDKAISFDELNRPIVNDRECNGCGICTNVCPTEIPAINIVKK